MEHIEGESLQERLKKGPLPIAQALRHAVEIADALDKATGMASPPGPEAGQVMLTKSGAKLLDFGLAKLTAPDRTEAFDPGHGGQAAHGNGDAAGNLPVHGPRAARRQGADARSDVFAFGAVLYEMVTGQKAFEGKSQASLISAIMGSEPPPRRPGPLAPPALERVVRTCLAKDPYDRWQSSHDVAELRGSARRGRRRACPRRP